MLLDHTERHPVRLWNLWARCFNAVVGIKRGDLGALGVLRAELDETGDARFLPRFLLPLAELATALGEAGEVAQGLATVDETLAHCRARSEGWYIPELLRIRGELLLRQAAERSSDEAADCFRDALKAAGEQGMLFWGLRAALSFARLLVGQDRREDARGVLQPVYDRITEGSGTPDMRAAKRLLDSL
jgi:predicted ATPase